MKKYFSTFFALFCFVFLSVCISASQAEYVLQSGINNDILRLHILANSDDDGDQLLKMKVRDAIMPQVEELFVSCETLEEAMSVAKEEKLLIENAAKAALLENGSHQSVRVAVGKEYYPQKTYKDKVFPKGEYLSVRIYLGKGKGHNWWCVLFPSLGNVGVEYKNETVDKKTPEIFGCRVKLKFLEYFK